MPAIKLDQFGGMLPAWEPRLLPAGQAGLSRNGYMFSGALVGWRSPKRLRNLLNASTRYVYRVPTILRTQARAFLIFLSQPNDGDTVVVGEETYTWRTTLSAGGQPFEVLIGANTTDTATHLGNALTADSGQNTNAGVQYGTSTPLNTDVKYFLPDTDPIAGQIVPTVGIETINATDYVYLLVGAVDFGASYNLITVGESTSNTRTTWLYDTLALTHTTSTYRGGTNPIFDNRIDGAATWLEFDDPDTNVFKSPIVDDQWNRYYSASPSQMPQYNTYDRIQAGSPFWLLGVPPPGCAVTLTVTGGGNNLTLGNFTNSGGYIPCSGNRIYLMKITTPGATQIQDVQFQASPFGMPADGYPAAHFAALVYTDDNGKPGDLLNTGEIVTGINADAPMISTFLNPTSLTGKLDYWIGFMLDTSVNIAAGPAGGGVFDLDTWENTFTNGPPALAPTLNFAQTQLTSDGVNVANGDAVKIGFNNYVFETLLTNVPGHVHIGANATASLTNLAHAINGSGGTPGVDYAASTTANSLVSSALPASLAIKITALAQTTVGSSVQTVFTPVGSPPHLTFDGPTLGSGFEENQLGLNMWGDFVTSDIIEARSYVYTWVSEYGEEGPPSPPTILDGWSNGTWHLGLWKPPPDDLGILRNLKKINIYRTVPGQGGQTVFFFVDTVDIGTDTFDDSNPNNEVALNDQLQSTNWFPPPANLQGFTVLQNGMVAAFTGNEIWFCEPFHPHAWPPGYVLTVDFPIVGFGTANGALIVCTAANPYVISGNAPTQMTQNKCAEANPCLSRASILSGDQAVSYMSQNGLIQVTPAAAATNTTDLWVARDNWVQLTPQHDSRAILLSSMYYCLGSVSRDGLDTSVAQTGFTIELDQDNTSFSIWPQPGGHRLGFNELDSPTGKDVQNLLTDPWTGIGLVVSDGSVWYFDFTDPAPTLATFTWRSKLYQQNVRRNYSAMKVFFKVPPGAPALNPVRLDAVASDPAWVSLPADRWGFLKTYVDIDGTGVLRLIDCREIRSSGELLRIVDGFKADAWQWEVTGRVPISNIQIATSVKELGQV